MLNFNSVRNKEVTMDELCGRFTPAELGDLTNQMIDAILALLADCVDDDVTFVPDDPNAFDQAAASEAEVNMPWTLGHVIVHTTASAEEAAFLAAELARGVQREGRSRFEIPWETVRTVTQCRERLEESRRMRLASLELWPQPPHMANTVTLRWLQGPINPAGRFVAGLMHEDSHLKQIAEIVRQARAARPG